MAGIPGEDLRYFGDFENSLGGPFGGWGRVAGGLVSVTNPPPQLVKTGESWLRIYNSQTNVK